MASPWRVGERGERSPGPDGGQVSLSRLAWRALGAGCGRGEHVGGARPGWAADGLVDWVSSPGWHVGVGLDHLPLARQVLISVPTRLWPLLQWK